MMPVAALTCIDDGLLIRQVHGYPAYIPSAHVCGPYGWGDPSMWTRRTMVAEGCCGWSQANKGLRWSAPGGDVAAPERLLGKSHAVSTVRGLGSGVQSVCTCSGASKIVGIGVAVMASSC